MRMITGIDGKGPTVFLTIMALAMVSVIGPDALAQDIGPDGSAPDSESSFSNIIVINNDGPGEGLNDPTSAEPVGGNLGVTLGAQRLAVFEAAAEVWEGLLESSVPIDLQAQFDPLFCTADTAVLGSAGPRSVASDFAGARVADTFYVAAQANQQAGIDLEPTLSDINATFNSSLGGPGCFTGVTFYLGIDGDPAPENTIGLFDTVLHEMAHGLGFVSLVDDANGEKFLATDDIFSRNLEDQTLGLSWPELSDAQRAASAVNTGNLQWTGAIARACAARVLNDGIAADGDVIMNAPNPLEPGSSVSHFDPSFLPDELMEPAATPTSILDLTAAAFADMGWPVIDQFDQLCQIRTQLAADQQ